jgi:hypothetical protein
MEIDLLEVGADNVGKNKKIDYIAGCLIAHACRESIKRGHDGFVFLTPKARLVAHYSDHYGMDYCPPLGSNLTGSMIADSKVALALIRRYLE